VFTEDPLCDSHGYLRQIDVPAAQLDDAAAALAEQNVDFIVSESRTSSERQGHECPLRERDNEERDVVFQWTGGSHFPYGVVDPFGLRDVRDVRRAV
jgi:hypothetical protein